MRAVTIGLAAAIALAPTQALALDGSPDRERPRMSPAGQAWIAIPPHTRLVKRYGRSQTQRTITIDLTRTTIVGGRLTLVGTLSPAMTSVPVGVAVIRNHRTWRYLAQTEPRLDGSFSVTVPFYNGEEYRIYVTESADGLRAETNFGVWID